jgi:hypothetical protein
LSRARKGLSWEKGSCSKTSRPAAPSGPATLDVWLPHGCGLEIGDRAEWVLRDRLTGEELQRQEVVSEVDLWRESVR